MFCRACLHVLQLRTKFYSRVSRRAHSCNHCCSRKGISITYSGCMFVALVIQRAKRMRRIVLSFVVCVALPHFSTLSHKRNNYRKNVIERTVCVLIFFTFVSSTGLFISPSGISELDCATTKTDTAERSISIGRESLQVSVLPYRCSICAPVR